MSGEFSTIVPKNSEDGVYGHSLLLPQVLEIMYGKIPANK